MPIHSFSCANGHRFDELFWQREHVPDHLDCSCGLQAKRAHANRFRVVGPVFEHLERYEKILLTDRQRAAGERIRSASDITRLEAKQGIHREDDTFYRVARDEMRHEEWQIKNVQRSGGVEAALDFVDDMNIREATGWDQKQVDTWKEETNAVEQSISSEAA